jgi:NADH:ubiquinone reductase (H+-translocating)
LPPDFRDIDARAARICLVEAGPRILPNLPEHLANYARKALEDLGVEVITGARVTNCTVHGVELEHGRIDADTVLWAAGVVASPAARWLAVTPDRAGRIPVNPDCSVPGLPNTFAVGDTAALTESGRPVPGLAAAAKQMGGFVGKLIAARLKGDETARAFHYVNLGDLATIGRNAAVVKLGRFELTGFLAWLFWGVVHIYFLIGIKNRLVFSGTWAWTWITRKRGARLITGPKDEV